MQFNCGVGFKTIWKAAQVFRNYKGPLEVRIKPFINPPHHLRSFFHPAIESNLASRIPREGQGGILISFNREKSQKNVIFWDITECLECVTSDTPIVHLETINPGGLVNRKSRVEIVITNVFDGPLPQGIDFFAAKQEDQAVDKFEYASISEGLRLEKNEQFSHPMGLPSGRWRAIYLGFWSGTAPETAEELVERISGASWSKASQGGLVSIAPIEIGRGDNHLFLHEGMPFHSGR